MPPSREDDLAAYVVRLERDLHKTRCALAAETEARQRAEASARAWQRVAEWIHAARPADSVGGQ